ncbi:hypothetical protein [Acidisoma cladoniae]|uniref:hypothetical protein n=1 Tax=Acidisoma cladoniae TaxID=3040935 RepID=UPI0025511145|nr:hypothetical protein [Acidisoma sp. PAMC 29798]
MSGLVRELLGIVFFLALGAFIFFDARKKATFYQVVGCEIVLFSFFLFYTIFTWKFVGF